MHNLNKNVVENIKKSTLPAHHIASRFYHKMPTNILFYRKHDQSITHKQK